MSIRSYTFSVLTIVGTAAAIPRLASAQSGESRFSVHGYLNQAYAESDRYPIFGITKDGTTDYRTVALQGRYALTDNDHFVVQVRNRRIGTFLTSDQGVALDWAYYQHDFQFLKVRLGKGPIPLGIYNDLRSVGTVLPFYRAPGNFYMEGIDAIEGIALTNRLGYGAWSLETTVYGGGVDLRLETVLPSPPGTFLSENHTENNAGVQMWLSTPMPGVRVGAGALRFRVPLQNDTSTSKQYIFSLDATFDRAFVRGEYKPNYVIVGTGIRQNAAYAQAGVKLIDKLSVNGQIESMNNETAGVLTRYAYDRAVSVNYTYQPNIVFKIEGHRNNGYNYDVFLPPAAEAPQTNYGIASVAVSF